MNEIVSYFGAACKATPGSGGKIIGAQCLPQPTGDTAINDVYIWVFAVIGGLAVLFLVIGGFQYITAGGDSAKIQRARSQIAYSLIGLVIAAFAGAITNLLINRL